MPVEIVYHIDNTNEDEKVKFLAFEGGGGKGIAFLGALAALEEVGVLGETNQIEGISGSSAGAITSYLVALGYNSKQLGQILSVKDTFNAFYDGPDNNQVRSVIGNTFQTDYEKRKPVIFKTDPVTGEFVHELIPVQLRSQVTGMVRNYPFVPYGSYNLVVLGSWFAIALGFGLGSYYSDKIRGRLLDGLGGVGLTVFLTTYFGPALARMKAFSKLKELPEEEGKEPFEALVAQITQDEDTLYRYVYNILVDRGLFPGFNIRDFFLTSMAGSPVYKENETPLNNTTFTNTHGNPSFEGFFNKTGIDFRLISTNMTTGRPQSFSRLHTPEFPVIDAVGMSASFPFAFKPVLVLDSQTENPQPRTTSVEPGDILGNPEMLGPEDGYYGDGGITNNIPMHEFDDAKDQPLNPHMLGIRLEDLSPGTDETQDEIGAFSILGSHAGDLFKSLYHNSELGRLRTTREMERTIVLDTSGLETLQFVAPIEKSGPRVIDAYLKTRFTFDSGFKVVVNGETIFDPNIHYNNPRRREPEEQAKMYKYVEGNFTREFGGIKKYDNISKVIDNLSESKIGPMLRDLATP